MLGKFLQGMLWEWQVLFNPETLNVIVRAARWRGV